MNVDKRYIFQVYTHFGRVLAEFPIGDELHHHALQRAREFAAKQSKDTWIRLV